jgi:hypothetical protein
MSKYKIQHVGRPQTSVKETDWQPLSEHASLKAAAKAIKERTKHLTPMTWDDHYRIIAPDGEIITPQEAHHRVSIGITG